MWAAPHFPCVNRAIVYYVALTLHSNTMHLYYYSMETLYMYVSLLSEINYYYYYYFYTGCCEMWKNEGEMTLRDLNRSTTPLPPGFIS